jgi:hypothetical protein
LKNTSATRCTLEGYPTITWELRANGRGAATPDIVALQSDEPMSDYYGPGFVAGNSAQINVAPDKNAMFYLALDKAFSSVSSAVCSETTETAVMSFPGWSTSLAISSNVELPRCPGSPFGVSPVGLEGSGPFRGTSPSGH